MVNIMLYKNTLIKIRKSTGRYLSILILVMVGVGFHAGIQASAPDISLVADKYYRSQSLMDFKIVSSMGLTQDDVNTIKNINGLKHVVPSYSLDVSEQDKVIRIHAIEEKVNTPGLTEGRMPRSETECVADGRHYKIGDEIRISRDTSQKLKNNVFTVVGLIKSVLYTFEDYGISTIGDGKLSSFIFIDKSNFILDAYTEIYIKAGQYDNAAVFTDKYQGIISGLNDELVKIKLQRENARYDEIYSKANDEISQNESEFSEEKKKGEKQLSDAKEELDHGAKEIKEAKDELINSQAKLQIITVEKNAEFESAKDKISDGRRAINSALEKLGVSEDELGTKINLLNSALQEINLQLAELPSDHPQYIQLQNTAIEYSANLASLKELQATVDTLNEQEKLLNDGIITFYSETQKAKNDIEKGKVEIAKNEKTIINGYAEYQENLNKFNAEISDAEKKIQDAKTKLTDIKQPRWYIFDRDAAVGYSELESAINVITAFSAVIPLFFIIIVILMTSNSMSRMITEERGELGTFTSLGYSDGKIISTYLLYVISATGLGVAAGFFLGCTLIPPLVYSNFPFILPPLIIQYDISSFLIILAVTLSIMLVVTIVGCRKQLRQKPADLMRPVSPRYGRKILLERMGPIWKRLSFIWKVTMRNLFRYKRRGFMTIAGITGCTAILLVGFGLRDSMDGVAQKQYGDIHRYSNIIVLRDETPAISQDIKNMLQMEQFVNPLLIKQSAYLCENDGRSIDAFFIVPQDINLFYEYYHLKSVIDNKKITLGGGGAVISQRIAKKLNIVKGDTITIKDADNNYFEILVANVTENYLSNYIYMEPKEYRKVFGEFAAYNALVSNYNGDEQEVARRLVGSDLVVNISFSSDTIQKAVDSNDSMNSIIALIIVVACLLAVIVLYNLTAINISERKREIATLKVLGFRDGETNAYIYREAMLLTLISIVLGIMLGKFLHSYVLNIIDTDARTLLRKIEGQSFVISGLLTLVFSIIMQVVTYFKLKSIDMIQSLKSAE
ncbi:MAG: FtsX-like permease family protein [Oscillospiraceae bacterium]|nr:FtsX-like permease family protein [Oscillospiraceae bacterium]